MRKKEIPKTDSIQELAHFWDMHDITDFEDQNSLGIYGCDYNNASNTRDRHGT